MRKKIPEVYAPVNPTIQVRYMKNIVVELFRKNLLPTFVLCKSTHLPNLVYSFIMPDLPFSPFQFNYHDRTHHPTQPI